jgi:hypothetical protein
VVGGYSYHRILACFSSNFRKLKRGKTPPVIETVPFWLALRYPIGADAMQRSISEHLRHTGCALVTIYAGA